MSSGNPVRCIFSTLTTLALLGAAGFGLWWWLGKPDPADVAGALADSWDNFFEGDPFGGSALDGNMTGIWPNDGTGLDLTILNALEDTWTQEFEQAIANWDNGGNPDVMTLTIERVTVEPACSQVDGVMKVCNDDYGDTGWLGINELYTNSLTNSIISSVAKMNEYYLLEADYNERLYTMCHEVGHGFGLPHTDENFNNLDLGNCLDYTRFPSNNLDPGEVNFAKLLTAYGPVSRRLKGRESVTKGRQAPDRSQRSVIYKRAMKELEDALVKEHQGEEKALASSDWTMVRRLTRGEHYIRQLGDGYQIEASVLRPITPDE